jgi:branched-chain amino acid transport system substrate-binding protein
MSMTRRALLGATTAAVLLPRQRARGAAAPALRIGIMTGGPGAIGPPCVRQAVEEFTAGKDLTIEVVEANHKFKAEIALEIARKWFDRDGVDAILDVPLTPPALAVSGLCREKNKVFVACDAGTPDLTGKACSPNTVHWSYDMVMLASTGRSVVKAGGDTWFIIHSDHLGGRQMLS